MRTIWDFKRATSDFILFSFMWVLYSLNRHWTKDLQRWEWQNVFRFFALSSCTCSIVSLELNGTAVVSYAALHSNKFTSNNATCSTSFSSILRSQHDLEQLSTATFTDYTAETQMICICYWVKRETSSSCYLTSFICPTLLNTLAYLRRCSTACFSLFKISNNGDFIDAPLCSALVITFPSKIYFTWYIFGGSNIKSKKLDLAMQNWKALR